MFDTLMTKDKDNHGHNNIRLVRFAGSLTSKDLITHNIPATYLKSLEGLDIHQVNRSSGDRDTIDYLAALLHTHDTLDTPAFKFWSPLFEIVYGKSTEDLADDFENHHNRKWS
ncbi:MAG: hypothetical protein M1838_002373 [Thelocarpon superellum]|nr:MAG: hypothetical protein M1838_002373 [Thelocarpon superellum]